MILCKFTTSVLICAQGHVDSFFFPPGIISRKWLSIVGKRSEFKSESKKKQCKVGFNSHQTVGMQIKML